MDSRFYIVKCITNMHMGSGDINFNIIDNEVQRDPVTGFPSMYSSSIKGALRKHFFAQGEDEETIKNIFGSSYEMSKTIDNRSIQPGSVKFLNGQLLFMPVRAAKGKEVYYLVTTSGILLDCCRLYTILTDNKDKHHRLQDIEKMKEDVYAHCHPGIIIGIENREYKSTDIKELPVFIKEFGKSIGIDVLKILIISDNDFKMINLPVIARNQLENGKSSNFWYEEVVPHESIFYFAALADDKYVIENEKSKSVLDIFEEGLFHGKDEAVVQFGAYSSIGYGLTKVEKKQFLM